MTWHVKDEKCFRVTKCGEPITSDMNVTGEGMLTESHLPGGKWDDMMCDVCMRDITAKSIHDAYEMLPRHQVLPISKYAHKRRVNAMLRSIKAEKARSK